VLVFSKTAGFRHSSIGPGHAAIEQLGADNNFQVDHTEDATAFSDPGDIGSCLHVERVEPLLVPADCTDGFYCAYWARPEAYLDPDVRAAISVFHLLDPAVCDRAVDRLRADLESGVWDERHGHLRELDALDVGYRLVVATP